FGTSEQREQLAAAIEQHAIEILIAGPLTRLGMDEAATLRQVRDFTLLVQDVRELSTRPVHILHIHHENRGGQVSGAWEGAGETRSSTSRRKAPAAPGSSSKRPAGHPAGTSKPFNSSGP